MGLSSDFRLYRNDPDAEASVEVFRRSRAQTENAISVLLGRTPESIQRGLTLAETEHMLDVPVGFG